MDYQHPLIYIQTETQTFRKYHFKMPHENTFQYPYLLTICINDYFCSPNISDTAFIVMLMCRLMFTGLKIKEKVM